MEKSKAFTQLSKLPMESDENLIIPIMWFEDVIDSPPENLQILLSDALSAGPNMASNAAIVAFTGLFMQIGLYFSFILWSYHKDELEDAG